MPASIDGFIAPLKDAGLQSPAPDQPDAPLHRPAGHNNASRSIGSDPFVRLDTFALADTAGREVVAY